MNYYPYSDAVILTDATYVDYGGHTGTSIDVQRSAAYWIAERTLCDELETFLLPTIVTGSYHHPYIDKFLILDHSYVSQIIQVNFIDKDEKVYWSKSSPDLNSMLRNSDRGLVDTFWLEENYNCYQNLTKFPHEIQIVYEAGLPTGTSNNPDILLALTTYSDIILNEITGYGNEAPGDIGVQEFYNQNYGETRVKLLRTSFGSSARAQFVRGLISKYRRRRFIQL